MGSSESNISVSVLFLSCLESPESCSASFPWWFHVRDNNGKGNPKPWFHKLTLAATAEGSQAEPGNQPLFLQRKITRTLCRVSTEQPAELPAFPSPLRLRRQSFINKQQRAASQRRQRPSEAKQATSDQVVLPPLSDIGQTAWNTKGQKHHRRFLEQQQHWKSTERPSWPGWVSAFP